MPVSAVVERGCGAVGPDLTEPRCLNRSNTAPQTRRAEVLGERKAQPVATTTDPVRDSSSRLRGGEISRTTTLAINVYGDLVR